MVAHGRIAKPIGLIKEALREFYASEKDDEAEKPETTDMKVRKDKNINKTAEAIKSMLTVVKKEMDEMGAATCAMVTIYCLIQTVRFVSTTESKVSGVHANVSCMQSLYVHVAPVGHVRMLVSANWCTICPKHTQMRTTMLQSREQCFRLAGALHAVL